MSINFDYLFQRFFKSYKEAFPDRKNIQKLALDESNSAKVTHGEKTPALANSIENRIVTFQNRIKARKIGVLKYFTKVVQNNEQLEDRVAKVLN